MITTSIRDHLSDLIRLDAVRVTVEDATVTLNDQVFADVGMSSAEAGALVAAIETLRHHAGDF